VDQASVVVIALVVGEAAFDALEMAGFPDQAVRLEERKHSLGGTQLLAAIRHGVEEDFVRAILSLLPEDTVAQRRQPLYLVGKLRTSQSESQECA